MLKIRDIITLDDANKYMVISKVEYKNDNYVYLINVDDNSDLKILKLDGEAGKLIIVEQAVIEKLIPLFLKDVSKYASLFNDELN